MRKWVLILSSAIASPAAAQSDVPSSVADGMYITVAEVRSNSMDVFQAFAGADGGPIPKERFLSTEIGELVPNTPNRKALEKLFSALDANSNGQLTLSEWQRRLDRDLQFADQNEDGKITLKELANARKNMSFGDALGMVF